MPPTITDIENLARQAGELLRAGYGNFHQVDHKSTIDLVTEMDRQSEELLIKEIRRNFPADQIVTEESGSLGGRDCCVWFIDPLDGTVNYAHHIPLFCVSIAYAEDGCVRRGAVYDPMRDEMFTAELGEGAWLNGRRIRVSDAQELDQSLLVTGFPYDIRTNPHNNLDNYVRFALCSQGVRRLGSAALDLCYVACGRFDGFWEIRLNPWDLAAGGLIAQEAGARVTDLSGGSNYLQPPCSVLAAVPRVHAQMLEVLQHSKP